MEEYIKIPVLDMISGEGLGNIERVFPSFSFSGFVEEITSGGSVFQADRIIESMIKLFANELYGAIRVLSVIAAVIVLGAIAETLRKTLGKNGFNASSVATIAVICGLCVNMFASAAGYAKNVSGDMTAMMAALIPVIITLLAGSGFAVSASITHPILYLMCNVFANVFDKVLIPLSVIYLAVSLLDTLSDAFELSALSGLIKKIFNFTVGLTMTLFTGILSLSGFAAVSLDSLTAKGAKFAVSSMVPFVGGSISDALASVASASLMLKNAVGVSGIAAIVLLCAVPVIKEAALIFSIRVCAAVCEPIADKKAVKMLSSVADSLSMINASVISTAVMMIISTAIIIGVR